MIPIEGPAHSTNLTDGCWDCECETDYIHARIRESKCEKCGVTEEDGPDSHAHEAAEIESLRMTAKESMEYVGMCPFCHHSEVDEDGDGECTCEACGKGWKAERRIVGYSWTDSAGNYDEETDEPEGRIRAIEQERDRLREELERVRREPSPEEIDIHLDRVLRASGSALRNYSLASFLRDKMRKAMREAMESPRAARFTTTQEAKP